MGEGTSPAGRDTEPDVAGEVLRSLRDREPWIRLGIAAGVLFFGLVAVLLLVSRSGPTTTGPRVLLVVVAVSTLPAAAAMSRLKLVDIWWMRGRRTTLLNAVFASYAVAGVAIAAATAPNPENRLYGACLMAVMSVYVAQFAPRWLLVIYVTVTSAIILVFAGQLAVSTSMSVADVALRALIVLAVVNGNVPFLAAYTASLRQTLQTQFVRATRDPLTGLLNRRGLENHVMALAGNGVDVLTVMTLDIDDFKRFNDDHGHVVGDKVLCDVARRMSAAASGDWGLARLGGDEFAVVAPLDADTATAECERLVARLHFRAVGAEVRVSLGAAVVPTARVDDVADFLTDAMSTADDALYRAKRTSRGAAVVLRSA